MNGYNFTDRVRGALAMAREEAFRLGHPYTGTEHILLGLLRRDDGIASELLENLGIASDHLRQRIEAVVKWGRPESMVGSDLPYTNRAKKVLELAMSEARELRHDDGWTQRRDMPTIEAAIAFLRGHLP